MKKSQVAIIDYHSGNLFSVEHACEHVGLKPIITNKKTDILNAQGVILPGVGAFPEAMKNLKRLDLISSIKDFIQSGRPFMGICLGMQLLFSGSEEFGPHKGLDIIKGNVVRFPKKDKFGDLLRIPQIGWNKIYTGKKSWKNSYLKNIKENEFMYFVHSFYCKPADIKDVLSLTNYEGIEFCSSILRDNVFATQFHPEKSGKKGIEIYQNFALGTIKRKNYG